MGGRCACKDGDLIEYEIEQKRRINQFPMRRWLGEKRVDPPPCRVHDGYLRLYAKLGNPGERQLDILEKQKCSSWKRGGGTAGSTVRSGAGAAVIVLTKGVFGKSDVTTAAWRRSTFTAGRRH